MVKQAATVPAEVTPLVIIASVGHLDVPEVLWDMRLDLPSNTDIMSPLLHIMGGDLKDLTRRTFLWFDVSDRHQTMLGVSFKCGNHKRAVQVQSS